MSWNPISWFKPVGSWIKKAFTVVEKFVSDESLAKAVEFVKIARDKFPTNDERKKWVLGELMKLGLSENIANIALEIAVRIVKAAL